MERMPPPICCPAQVLVEEFWYVPLKSYKMRERCCCSKGTADPQWLLFSLAWPRFVAFKEFKQEL